MFLLFVFVPVTLPFAGCWVYGKTGLHVGMAIQVFALAAIDERVNPTPLCRPSPNHCSPERSKSSPAA